MDARLLKLAVGLSVVLAMGASHRTENFVVRAPTAKIARQVGLTAERYREKLSIEWLGKKMPRWSRPCSVRVKVGQIGAGGATTFAFDRGEVFGWRMNVQGTLERILDSVVPHEVSHTIFATHFRRPLPRWADEGAATLVEHESEQRRQRLLLKQVMQTGRRIPLQRLLSMKEYPQGMQNVLTLYAQGYSLADYLVQQGGRQRYLAFLEDAHRRGWNDAIQSHYDLRNVDDLEERWDAWVTAGSPRLNLDEARQLADAGSSRVRHGRPGLVVRSQSPDPGEAVGSRGVPRENLQLPASAVDGRRSATGGRQPRQNKGWAPMADQRLPRPEPLTLRIDLSANREGTTRRLPAQAGNRGRAISEETEQHRQDPFLPNGSE